MSASKEMLAGALTLFLDYSGTRTQLRLLQGPPAPPRRELNERSPLRLVVDRPCGRPCCRVPLKNARVRACQRHSNPMPLSQQHGCWKQCETDPRRLARCERLRIFLQETVRRA